MNIQTRRKVRDHNAPTMGKSVQAMARKGRAGDTEVAHLTPGEVVVPKRVWQADPGLRRHASMAMQQAGLDPSQYVVGSSRNSRNPQTGAREFADLAYVNGQWVNSGTGQAADFGADQNSFANTGTYSSQPQPQPQPTPRPGNAMNAPAPQDDRDWGADQSANQELARITGYQGDFGTGGFSTYMQGASDAQQQGAEQYLNSQGRGQRIDWNTGVTPADDGAANNYGSPVSTQSWGDNQNNYDINRGLAQTTGYTGNFGGGAFNEWLATQPQSVTDQVGQYLTDNGQADRANLYAWDRNANGAVEGTEAAGVTYNPDGSFTFPGGYNKGPLKDPFTTPGATVPIINPNIEGAPPAYAWGTGPDGMMPAGAWPDTMRDPVFGTTTYNAAPPPNANGQWINPQFLPWDVRNGGTGDPYTPWTPEWAANQAAQGSNGYAAQALENAGGNLSTVAPGTSAAALKSGQGGSNAAGWDRGSKLISMEPVYGFSIWQHPDGSFYTSSANGEIKLEPVGNGLYWDTVYGALRNQKGVFVNQDGSPIVTPYSEKYYSQSGTSDPWRLWGSTAANQRMGNLSGVDLTTLRDGNNTPVTGAYGRSPTQAGGVSTTPVPLPSPGGGTGGGGAGGTGGGGTTVPTSTGTGLTPGAVNPFSMPINFFLGNGGTNTGTNTQAPTQQQYDPLSWLSLLNLGYGSSTYGQPTYTSADPNQAGGINYVQPNSQNVEFRTPFAYS